MQRKPGTRLEWGFVAFKPSMPVIDFFRQHLPLWPAERGPFTVLFQANAQTDLHAFLVGLDQAQHEGLGPIRVLAVLPLGLTHVTDLACPQPGLPGWQHWQTPNAQWHALCTNEPVKAARQWPGQCGVDYPSGRLGRQLPDNASPAPGRGGGNPLALAI